MPSEKDNQRLATRLIHGDSELVDDHIGPAIAVSSSERCTTFPSAREDHTYSKFPAYRYPELTSEEWKAVDDGWDELNPNRHYYSRYTTNPGTRVEKILGKLHVSILLRLSLSTASI